MKKREKKIRKKKESLKSSVSFTLTSNCFTAGTTLGWFFFSFSWEDEPSVLEGCGWGFDFPEGEVEGKEEDSLGVEEFREEGGVAVDFGISIPWVCTV